MGLEQGGWDVITTAHPPAEATVGENVSLVIDYFGQADHEPKLYGRDGKFDLIAIVVTRVAHTHHNTIIEGRGAAGVVHDLIGRNVRAIVNTENRHGYVELTYPDA